jgi:hypothetical protein
LDNPTRLGPPRRLDYAGWTYCSSGQFPALVARCRLRVRKGFALGDAMVVEEIVGYYDPVGWLLESGARITNDNSAVDAVIAWRLAE